MFHQFRNSFSVLFMGKKREKLAELLRSKNYSKEVAITLTLCSRKLGNRDHALAKLFESLVRNTSDLSRIEVLIACDDDDDLHYFYKMKIQHPVQCRFFVAPRGLGYGQFHTAHEALIKNRDLNSQYNVIVTDDAVFSLGSWDEEIYKLIKRQILKERREFQILMPSTLKYATTIISQKSGDREVSWTAGADFPITSFALLDSIAEFVSQWDEWTCFGNTFNIDSFFGDILRQLSKRNAEELFTQIPEIITRGGITSYTDPRWPIQKGRAALRQQTLIKYMEDINLERRKRIGEHLASTSE